MGDGVANLILCWSEIDGRIAVYLAHASTRSFLNLHHVPARDVLVACLPEFREADSPEDKDAHYAAMLQRLQVRCRRHSGNFHARRTDIWSMYRANCSIPRSPVCSFRAIVGPLCIGVHIELMAMFAVLTAPTRFALWLSCPVTA